MALGWLSESLPSHKMGSGSPLARKARVGFLVHMLLFKPLY